MKDQMTRIGSRKTRSTSALGRIESPLAERLIERPLGYYRRWQYRNTGLLVMSISLCLWLVHNGTMATFVETIGSFGYLSAFAAGFFFVSIFTVAPAAVVLYGLADAYEPWLVASLAGAGGVVGDYLIFRFFQDRVVAELRPLVLQAGGRYIRNLFRTPYFTWLLPFIGAFVIASPFPDEIGISLLGLAKVKRWQFLLLTFCLNALGIFLIVTAARV